MTTVTNNLASRFKGSLIAFMQSDMVLNVNLTTDGWTSTNNKSYTCITASLLISLPSEELTVEDYLLEMYQSRSHTGINLASELCDYYNKYGAWNKTSFICTDNARNMATMASDILKIKSDSKIEHARCISHVLNLITKEFYSTLIPDNKFDEDSEGNANIPKTNISYILDNNSEVSKAIQKIKKLERELSQSPQSAATFSLMCKAKGYSRTKLRKFCKTRWNSFSFLLSSAIDIKEVIQEYTSITNEDFEKIESIVKFLSGIEHLTNIFSAETPGAWLILGCFKELRYQICCFIEKNPEYYGSNMRRALNASLKKLDYYMELLFASKEDQPPKPFVLAAFFHPYYRITLSDEELQAVTKYLSRFLDQKTKPEESNHGKIERRSWMARPSGRVKIQNTELELYLNQQDSIAKFAGREVPVTVDGDEDIDVSSDAAATEIQGNYKNFNTVYSDFIEEGGDLNRLEVIKAWRKRSIAYPILSEFAVKYLSMPTSSTASERTFSTSRRILTADRNSLSDESFANLLVLKGASKNIQINKEVPELDDTEENKCKIFID
ncbi:hypothetical protein CAAN3_07S05952 [[Candida] anglica]